MEEIKGSSNEYVALEDGEYEGYGGTFDKPLPYFGCGIGWFLFLLGVVFPLAWYFGTFLYLTNHYKRDLRERSGLGACATAALICTFVVSVIILIMLLTH